MTVKLLLLKSGEDIIADVTEMVIGEGENIRVIGYFFENPCSVKVFATDNDENGNIKTPCKLQLTSWIPLTSDKRISVPADWVVTMVEPIEQLKEMYKRNLPTDNLNNGKNNQNISVDGQSDSDNSD